MPRPSFLARLVAALPLALGACGTSSPPASPDGHTPDASRHDAGEALDGGSGDATVDDSAAWDAGEDAPSAADAEPDAAADHDAHGLDAAGDAGIVDGSAGDGSAGDGSAGDGSAGDGSAGDGSAGDGGTETCALVAPTLGVRTPTAGRTGTLGDGSFAIDPCTGQIGFAWSERTGSDANSEIYFTVLSRDGSTATPVVRVTAAPGPSILPRVVWNRDRFGVFWADQRHDRLPDGCTSNCRIEMYYAAFGRDGRLLVAEARLTNKPGMVLHPRAAVHPTNGEMALTWVDRRASTEIYAALVAPDGAVRLERQINETTPTHSEAYTPSVAWHGGEWLFVYSDRRSSTDRVYTRSLSPAGVLGPERSLAAGYRPEFAVRGPGGFTVLSEGSPPSPSLRFFDPSWMATSTVPASSASHYDGSWRINWDGTSHWVTSQNTRGMVLVRYNALGVELESVVVDPLGRHPRAQDVELERVGDVFVVEYQEGVGSRHRIAIARP